jgi:hypothetical protein
MTTLTVATTWAAANATAKIAIETNSILAATVFILFSFELADTAWFEVLLAANYVAMIELCAQRKLAAWGLRRAASLPE